MRADDESQRRPSRVATRLDNTPNLPTPRASNITGHAGCRATEARIRWHDGYDATLGHVPTAADYGLGLSKSPPQAGTLLAVVACAGQSLASPAQRDVRGATLPTAQCTKGGGRSHRPRTIPMPEMAIPSPN
jgi:hypothetical protein